MSRVCVVGGGLAGLASAARLAKLGHDVVLLEARPVLGGAVHRLEAGGFTWDAGPHATVMPAVLRDLFRKSGRPLEAEAGADLEPLPLLREHRFEDDTVMALPGATRAGQAEAWDALAPGLGQQWTAWVDRGGEDWEVLRRGLFEEPWTPDGLSREVRALVRDRATLRRRALKAFRDPRARAVALHPAVAAGHDPRDVPAWLALTDYLEQRFGLWTLPGGFSGLTDLLARRLATRGVAVHTGTRALDLRVEGGRVTAVIATGPEGPLDVPADVVVVAAEPRRLPALARYVARTLPALPPLTVHLGLSVDPAGGAPADGLPEDLRDLPHEVVLHGDPTLVVRTTGTAPEGGAAWTVQARGRLSEDVTLALARAGLDVRPYVVERVDRTARTAVEDLSGTPYGVLWQGRGTLAQRLGPDTPVRGVYAAGAWASPAWGVPFVGLTAAQVAARVGPA